MARARGRLHWALCAGLAVVLSPSLAAQDPSDTAAEQVLVELQMGRIASRTVTAYRIRSEALIPLTQFLEMAEIQYRLSPEGRLEGVVEPGHRPLIIDVALDTARLGTHHVPIDSTYRLLRDGELYLGAERLGDLLGARILVDWPELTVSVVDPTDLPIGRRLYREAARDAFLRGREGVIRADRSLGLERARWGGAVFDYSLLLPSSDPVDAGAYTAGVGADVGGGSLEASVASLAGLAGSALRGQASWTGIWRDHRYVKQLRLGDGQGTGPRARPVRGVAVSNSPFIRTSALGDVLYDGSLQPGWAVEAYRGGRLIAYDSTDDAGRFRVLVPVSFGENPVDFIGYGPFGEVQEFNRTYRVLGELLPAGRFEYGASGGSCRDVRCRATGNVDLRYGASPRWTVRAGVDHFWRDSLRELFHPYASVVGSVTNAWGIEAEAVANAFVRAAARYEPSLHLRVTVEGTRFDSTPANPILTGTGLVGQWGVSAFVRPIPTTPLFFFDASVDRLETGSLVSTRARLGASFQGDAVRLLPFLRFERLQPSGAAATSATYAGVNSFILPRAGSGRLLAGMLIRANLEMAGIDSLMSASIFVSRPLWSGVRFESGLLWTRAAVGNPTLQLIVSSYLPAVRTVTSASVPRGATATGSQYVQGSVLWDGTANRVRLAPGPSLERAGLTGRVFFDANANGIRDADEPGLANVGLRIGTTVAVSDSNGAFHVWDLVPFEPIMVVLDSLSLENPLWVPAYANVSVVPGPNRFRSLDLPVVQGGEVEGRVIRSGDGRDGVGGVTLVLTEVVTGVRRTVVTFTDGSFYLLGLKPGSYRVTVDEPALQALGVTAEPTAFQLRPGATSVAPVEIRLTPRAAP
jgi:hypothetical protein